MICAQICSEPGTAPLITICLQAELIDVTASCTGCVPARIDFRNPPPAGAALGCPPRSGSGGSGAAAAFGEGVNYFFSITGDAVSLPKPLLCFPTLAEKPVSFFDMPWPFFMPPILPPNPPDFFSFISVYFAAPFARSFESVSASLDCFPSFPGEPSFLAANDIVLIPAFFAFLPSAPLFRSLCSIQRGSVEGI